MLLSKDMKLNAIGTNLETLEKLLYEAHVCVSEGVAAIRQGEQNGAVGAVLSVEEMLKQATALLYAIIAIHRM